MPLTLVVVPGVALGALGGERFLDSSPPDTPPNLRRFGGDDCIKSLADMLA